LTLTASAFLPGGKSSPPRSARFGKTSLLPAAQVEPRDLEPGLKYYRYEGEISSIQELSHLTPLVEGSTSDVGSQSEIGGEHFGVRFEGYIRVPESGVYTFYLASDDGSGVAIGDRNVVVNDGLHGIVEESGMVALEEGNHPITILYFQAGGGMGLQLLVRRPNEEERQDPEGWLFHLP
jgi:hypothetical protein